MHPPLAIRLHRRVVIADWGVLDGERGSAEGDARQGDSQIFGHGEPPGRALVFAILLPEAPNTALPGIQATS
jgi:hypothetical protein